jgi:hypothetical protein
MPTPVSGAGFTPPTHYSSADGPDNVGASSSSNDASRNPVSVSAGPLSDLSAIGKDVYRRNVVYHGTSAPSKRSIQDGGFDTSKKTNGATSVASAISAGRNPGMVANAAGHHFVTPVKPYAKWFATTTSPTQPALVRTLGAHHDIPFEPDPNAGTGQVAGKFFPD